jgi:geranylgeranyl transferase type-2 subunit beta
MTEPTYLERLAVNLAPGAAQLSEERCVRHAAYLLAAQNPDGGYSGRAGPSDLYYTGFALRSLALLGALPPDVAERAAGFLRAAMNRSASVVDFFSLLYAARLIQTMGGPDVLGGSAPGWQDRTATILEAFRTPDGGYAKTPGAASGSTYHTFLVALSYELIERPLPEPERVRAFLHSRRRADGGYVEVGVQKRSGTNPTAAAVATLRMLGGEPADESAVSFLASLVSAEGGFCANTRVPLADLLSTFTGLWTLYDLGALDRLDPAAARGYVEALERPAGGFRGGAWDDGADVEYTFYGLGSLALLSLPT